MERQEISKTADEKVRMANVGETADITLENLWETIEKRQGEIFYTVKQLPFSYTVKGGEFFTPRKKKSITKATFEMAFMKIKEDYEHRITGPKALNCFGAPYVWAVLKALGIKAPEQ